MADDVYHFKMERLRECGFGLLSWSDPWGANFSFEMIGLGHTQESTRFDDIMCSGEFVALHAAEWHAGRIRYLIAHPKELCHPIMVDCECVDSRVLAIPTMTDGWHRFFAHQWLGRETIAATFCGLVDLREWLEGVTDIKPKS